MLKVTDVTPLDGHQLRVEFNDGVVRVIDCSFLLRGTLGEPLRDLAYFRQVRVDPELRTIVWPNGLDPAHEDVVSPFRRRVGGSRRQFGGDRRYRPGRRWPPPCEDAHRGRGKRSCAAEAGVQAVGV